MISVSDKFTQALKGSRTIVVKADILREGIVLKEGLDVISGSIATDATANVRRRLSITFQDSSGELIPETASDLLWPNGNEIRIRYGLLFPNGVEYIPLGLFRISGPRFTDDGSSLKISATGYDRSRTISRNRFAEPYIISAGTNYATAIRNLIQSRFPSDLDFSQFMETTRTTPGMIFEAMADPWEVAQEMASSLGAEVFFDHLGRPVLRPEPDPESEEINWEYVEGSDCTMTEIERDLDDERTYNHVVVTGESTYNTTPHRAEAFDNDPLSPTFVDGPYGRVTYFYVSQYITTQAQAQDAAEAQLRRVLGTIEQVSFGGISNPTHEAGDILQIARQRVKVNARYVLDAFTLPLASDGIMAGITRQRRV